MNVLECDVCKERIERLGYELKLQFDLDRRKLEPVITRWNTPFFSSGTIDWEVGEHLTVNATVCSSCKDKFLPILDQIQQIFQEKQ